MEQRSAEWFAARLGRVTASKVSDVMAKGRSNTPSKTRLNYMMQLMCERLTGNATQIPVTAAMQRGTDLEPIARAEYESITVSLVDEVGLINHPDIEWFAASPDGLVDDGLVEIKCPNTATHIEFIETGKIPSRYKWQMSAQLACTKRAWCDFASYDDRLPDDLKIKIVRYTPPPSEIEILEAGIKKFLAELEDRIRCLTNTK